MQEYFAAGEDTSTRRLQASLARLRGVCEADSWNEFHEPLLNGSCIDDVSAASYMQEYRSGHNEAVLKTSFVCLCNPL